MKNLNNFIQEKYLIDKDFNEFLSLDDFIKEINNIFDLGQNEAVKTTNIILSSLYIDNVKYFENLENNIQNHELFNDATELMNHPHKFGKNKWLYILNVIDLYIYGYDYERKTKYVYFIDHINDKIYIYKIVTK